MPNLRQAAAIWLRIGCLSFGGPAGQVALMHREVVEMRRWVGEHRFLQALNLCTLLPGPEAQQLAVYLGWLMHGVPGGLVAGTLFVLPGALVMLGLCVVYVALGSVPLVAALFFGLRCAVLIIVAEAVARIGRRALQGRWAVALACASFVALFVLHLPFWLVMVMAGLLGASRPDRFAPLAGGPAGETRPALLDAALAADPGRTKRHARAAHRAGLLCLAAWLAPVAILAGVGGRFADVARYFAFVALVTFGGAYAVLASVAQEAVASFQWLTPAEMLAGLGLAETTPGPLILVLQFVGFLAGYRAPAPVGGLAGGVLASLLTLWVTFVPCFAFVFLAAPLVESLGRNRRLSGALAAITAAVVGVVANLALWFGLHVIFAATREVRLPPFGLDVPVLSSVDPAALALAGLAALALLRFRLGVPATLAISAAASLLLRLAG